MSAIRKLIQYINHNRHLLFLLYIPFYIIMFFLLEQRQLDSYWSTWIPLDDHIPFCEYFVIPYYLWYPFLFAPGLYALLRDIPALRRYMTLIISGYTFSLLFCLLVPNGQDLRPTSFARDNIFTSLVSLMYSVDTNTNVFPSVHVFGAIAALTVTVDCDGLRRRRWPVVASAVLCTAICASTVLIKQHSILDFFGAVALAVPLILLIYRKRLFRKREKENKKGYK